ncbi:MAG: amidohydrolase, partial [Dehalococcoidia bacterium]|nr:amidohydrolase [Dehalococcoidia bacterium]
MDRLDNDGIRLPIKIDSTSNGEYEPIPITTRNEQGNKLALDWATKSSRRLGKSRRKFLISSCGAASTLLALNHANAYHNRRGGFFDVRDESAIDNHSANAQVGGNEFIFDVQGHYVNPEGDWLSRIPSSARPYAGMEKAACEAANSGASRAYLNCLSESEFIKDIFLDSDTDIMVLSFVPSTRENEPVTIEDADQTRRIVAELE